MRDRYAASISCMTTSHRSARNHRVLYRLAKKNTSRGDMRRYRSCWKRSAARFGIIRSTWPSSRSKRPLLEGCGPVGAREYEHRALRSRDNLVTTSSPSVPVYHPVEWVCQCTTRSSGSLLSPNWLHESKMSRACALLKALVRAPPTGTQSLG